jgi:hypothetical protein
MWSPSCRVRLLAAGLVAAGTLFTVQGSSSAVTSPWPGLPDDPDATGWFGTAQTGITEAARAKQWVRVPLAMMAVGFNLKTQGVGTLPDGREFLSRLATTNDAWLVSPAGSARNYGDAPPIKVRTVAFGSIPVTATIAVSQRRDANGVPVPIRATTVITRFTDNSQYVAPALVNDAFAVRVTDVAVDGVDLDIGDDCHAVSLAPFTIHSESYTVPGSFQGNVDDPAYFDPTKNFLGQDGGTLTGTIDIPAFTGCGTASGDDVSRLLTASVSGAGNPMTVRLGATGCFTTVKGVTLPPGPGADTPAKANCQDSGSTYTPSVPDPLPLPTR